MNVVFRADASREIGAGHVMRCLTLADALRERDVTSFFVCRGHQGHLGDLIEQRGYHVCLLPVSTRGTLNDDSLAHASWLGASWREDAEKTQSSIEGSDGKPDWLVVDHYALDRRWESALRPSVGRVMVIDDLADRRHDCDLLLDQNLVEPMQTRYVDRVPSSCGMLLGPSYALLQPIYAELHNRIPPRDGPIRRVLISFGGGNHGNLIERALSAFLSLNRPDIEVDLVIAGGSRPVESIRRQVKGRSNIHLHGRLPVLAPLMVRADLAIGAAGATSWERLCLGLPSLVVTLAENQRPIAEALNRSGLVRWLGDQEKVDESSLAQTLNELIRQGLEEDWSRRCLAAVDGKGVSRVRAAMIITGTTPLKVRHARLEDEAPLLEWANDPGTRRNAFSSEPIPAGTHRVWFRSRLRNLDGCRIYIVETTDGVAIGQVRFECLGQDWEVHYAVAPPFRGRGVGRPMLETAMDEFRADRDVPSIVGRVKVDNQPSRRILESLGFKARTIDPEGVVVYRRDSNDGGRSGSS